jgi:hypothetical protein
MNRRPKSREIIGHRRMMGETWRGFADTWVIRLSLRTLAGQRRLILAPGAARMDAIAAKHGPLLRIGPSRSSETSLCKRWSHEQ